MNAMWVTKFFYLLLAGIAYLFFCLYLPQFSAYLLLSILLLPLGFFLAAHLCGRKLQAEISLSERETHLQESCCCTVSLKNPTWLPIGTVTFFLSVENTTLHLGNQQEMQTSIAPRDTMQLEIPLVPSHCGQVRVTLHQCRIYDGIHLFSHRKRLNTSAVFTVLPGVPAPPVTDAGTQHGDAAVMQPTTEPEAAAFPNQWSENTAFRKKRRWQSAFCMHCRTGCKTLAVLWTLCWRHCSLPSPIFARTATVLP